MHLPYICKCYNWMEAGRRDAFRIMVYFFVAAYTMKMEHKAQHTLFV